MLRDSIPIHEGVIRPVSRGRSAACVNIIEPIRISEQYLELLEVINAGLIARIVRLEGDVFALRSELTELRRQREPATGTVPAHSAVSVPSFS
jgi:hypothetical protein